MHVYAPAEPIVKVASMPKGKVKFENPFDVDRYAGSAYEHSLKYDLLPITRRRSKLRCKGCGGLMRTPGQLKRGMCRVCRP